MVTYLSKKQGNHLIFLCWLIYSSAYLGRLNYSAGLVQILEDVSLTKAEGGIIASCFFFAYGVAQLVHGFLNRYYDPRWMIAVSMIGSAIVNLLFPLYNNLIYMCVLWVINGFIQAILWSTLIRTLSRYLDDAMMRRSILIMGTTTAVGTVVTYGFSALFVSHFSWKISFYFATVILAAVGIFWFFRFHHLICDIPERQTKIKLHQISGNKMGRVFILLVATLCIFGVLNNLIRDGLTTWTPSIFKDIYQMPDSLSILLTLGLPLLSILGSSLCLKVHKKVKDHIKLCSTFFLVAMLFLGMMILCMPLHSWIITLICFAISALMMASINNCITSIVPLELRDMADSGAIAGVTNTFCYLGSTISTYSLGAIADASGWNGAFIFLLLLCVFAIALCLIYLPLHHWLALDKKRKA